MSCKQYDVFRQPVSSTRIRSVGYDTKSRTLEIEVAGRGVFRYMNVPQNALYGLKCSQSKGLYFDYHISGRYAVMRYY